MNMEGNLRSGGVLKKKSSSGCLIIKKKVGNRNSGGEWEGVSKEKKRSRLVAGDLSESDEDESLQFMRRKVNDERLHNVPMGYKRSELENREYRRNNVGVNVSGERKRSKLELYEFDEYDEFNGKRMTDEYVEDSFEMIGRRGGENLKQSVVGSSQRNLVVEKRKSSYFDGSSSGRSKGCELEEDEADMPISLLRLKYQETADEPIRLQGKNGVLKVMVNKKKRMDLHPCHKKYDPREAEERAGSRSEDGLKKEFSPRMPIYPASKTPENRGLWVEKEKTIEKEKMEVKLEKVKPKLSKCIKVRESETDGTDTALKLATPGLQASSSKKGMKKEEERTPPESVTAVKGKEGKAKRGGCTEKQMLREKIREMLVDAGWTIDYRPRRNRDYLDAVYINPNGTAYWSIIKAYDALKKQLEEDNSRSKLVVDSPSFAPLAEDLINKLTRQTKKKIEEEMKRKRKEDGLTKNAQRSALRDAGESSDSDHIEDRLSSFKKQNYKSRKGKLPEVDQGSDGDLSDDSPKRKSRKIKVEKPTTSPNPNVLQGRTSKVIGRCTLLVRGSDKGEKSESDGYVPYSGKRTVLAWLIDSGTAQLSEKVQYMNRRRTRVMLEGWITRDGIHCGCCSKILPVSKFELHAGSKLRQPFQNIFLESGASLLQCQIDAWNRQGESVCRDFHHVDVDGGDPDDDTCGICGDGGALICCDSCPSTFHQICLEIQMLPSGDWHCPNCICKFCSDASGNAAEENDSTADELTRCSFCEKKYHKSCNGGVSAPPVSSNGASFCGLKCQELYDHLQKILGVKHELEAGFSWSLVQRSDVSDTSHRGFPQRVESNSKLAVALSVMDECFLPIIDRRSGVNMIRNVVYNIGSNFNRIHYRGFYMAILERGDEIVSAASIRIHGTRLAEMPFIGTREIYRRQGMCRRLLSAIETELRSLKVEQLIIPAISEHMNTWTSVFGFHQLEDALKKEIKSMNMLVFPGTDMLQKQLAKHSDGMKVSESIKNQSRLPVLVQKSDLDSSMEHDKQMSNSSVLCHDTTNNDKVNCQDSDLPAPAIPSNDNSAASTSDSPSDPIILLARNRITVINSESEEDTKQKEPSASLNGPPVPGDSNNISDIQSGLLDPPLKDSTDSSADVVQPLIAAEANGNHNPLALNSAELTNTPGNIGFSVKVSEDAEPQVTANNGSVESLPGSVCKASSHSATFKVNGEDIASFPTRVAIEVQPTILAVESELMEASPDSSAACDPKVSTVDSSILGDVEDEDRCDNKGFCTRENGNASVEVSAKDVVERMNENHNPAPTISRDTGETSAANNSEIDCKATTPAGIDKPDVKGEVASPISSSESLAHNIAPTENITGSSSIAEKNSR